MKHRGFRFHALSVGVMVALLAGCATPGALPQRAGSIALAPGGLLAMTTPRYAAMPQQPDLGRSWMDPSAKTIKELLYISDHHTNDVYVYDYKSGRAVGKLTGFHDPYGQCVDAKGDVWVANFSGFSVVEYAHGGSRPIKKLSTNGHAIGCSVAPQGDLSVANMTTPSGAGDIQLWKNASGTPSSYSNAQYCYYLWPPGDDNYGNMFVETDATNYACELYYGGSQGLMTGNSPFGRSTIDFPGGSMWDGQYLTFTDQEYGGGSTTAVYQTLEVPCGGLTVIGTTVLKDTCHGTDVDVVQPFVVGTSNTPVNGTQGMVVVGGNLSCHHRFDYWSYPAGGNPAKTLKSAPQEPYGASVSIASR
ncbi:MAG TPA: hypothetical protein VGX91_11895 [Candidatus Cybelea sp.]|nr:hypothetical protein [Candidatus Cybelea sp.]